MFACGDWFQPDWALLRRLWKVMWLWWLLHGDKFTAVRKTGLTGTKGKNYLISHMLRSSYAFPQHISRSNFEIHKVKCSFGIVSCTVSFWYSEAVFRGLQVLQRHVIPLCKCCGKFSKVVSFGEREQCRLWSVCCLCWRCTGSGPAMAPQYSTNNCSCLPPPTFIPTTQRPSALSRHNGYKELRVL